MRPLVILAITACIISTLSSPATAAATATTAQSWHDYKQMLGTVQIRNETLAYLLRDLLSYEFTLPEAALERGLVYTGSATRLRKAVQDMLLGKRSVKIGVIGASISWGHGTSVMGKTDWVSLFSTWVTSAFKTTKPIRNGCVPATPSAYMAVCLDQSVDQDVDLVFCDYVLNDGQPVKLNSTQIKDYERLVRRVLALPSKPSMVMMQVLSNGHAFQPGHIRYRPFHWTIEDMYGALGQYYDVAWLSLRSSTYWLANFRKVPEMHYNRTFFDDGLHPNDRGHKLMADLAVWLILQTAIDVLMRPLGAVDVDLLREPLPPPMIHGNVAPSSPMCIAGEGIKALLVDSKGWEFKAEGRNGTKKGYVATAVGSVLRLSVDSRRAQPGYVMAEIAYLRSYVHMGVVSMSCIAGCNCTSKEVDGHQQRRVSQTYTASVKVSQHERCILSLTVLERSNSPGKEHKFKISAVVLSDQAGHNHHAFMQDVFFTPESYWTPSSGSHGKQ